MALNFNSSNKRISTFIVVVPPLVMLIYALISYSIFFNGIEDNNNKVMSHYKKSSEKTTLSIIKSRALTLNNFINVASSDFENFKKLLNSIVIKDEFEINLVKDNKILYGTRLLDKNTIEKLSHVEGKYKNKNIVAYVVNNKKTGIKVIVYKNKQQCIQDITNLKQSLKQDMSKRLNSSLYLLVITWFALLLLSLIIAIKVFNKLKYYEKEIEKNNDNIIFNSKQALLGELLPMIAHQWRQPLNKIASILMSMRFEISKPQPNQNTLDMQSQEIEDSVELMSQTIDDFRTFYRPKKDATNTDLALLVRKALFFLNELLTRKKIRISHTLPSVMIKIHENEFLQVLINLIKNASDAVSVQGSINIILRELNDGRIELRIEDDGVGIPEDKLDKIFEAHESSKVASMGLGLYMSKIIIEDRLGGTIKAYNTPKGAGFVITLFR